MKYCRKCNRILANNSTHTYCRSCGNYCLECGIFISRGSKRCRSCAGKIKEFTETHKRNLSKAMIGKRLTEQQKARLSLLNIGKKLSEETKMRKAAINRLKRHSRYGIDSLLPSFSPKACRIIDEYGKQHGYNFQHAMNGGEFQVTDTTFFVDGYDKENNIVIEYYENFHHKTKESDSKRKEAIVRALNCEFIIIRE